MIPPKTEEKLIKRIKKLNSWRYQKVVEVALEAAETMEHFRRPPAELSYKPAPIGSKWGENWGTVWFRGVIEIPASCKGKRVYYRNRSDAERMLFINDVAYNGMDPYHNEALLTPSANGDERIPFYVEAYCGHPVAHGDSYNNYIRTLHCVSEGKETPPPLPLEASELVVERESVSALFFDTNVLLKTAQILDENSRRRAVLFNELNSALSMISMHWETEEELEESAQKARAHLAPLLEMHNSPSVPTVAITGHAHIDVAWCWPVKETIRKTARTFSTMLNLMKEYPELHFQQSQMLLYQWIEDYYPELLPQIKERVAEGRWEPNGGMWVEADCNVPSGESLVRQFLEGDKKAQELFGYRADTLWLPDVFGYSAAMPQILKGCGIDNFVTNKITWNETNLFPYSTFWWEGIDGSTVLSQFLTTRTGNYNAEVLPEIMQETWNYVQQKETCERTLTSVGWGDGGGGVSREHCEHARRMKDLEGCLRTEFTGVTEYFETIRKQPVERPRWVGELYFEMHRGTYTSQARTKRYNRKLEFLLREVELYSVMAQQSGFSYPAETLQRLWRIVLTNQFHDILPGSSITRVYTVAEEEYAAVEAELLPMRDAALQHLAAHTVAADSTATHLVANSLSWQHETLVQIESASGTMVRDTEGRSLPCQQTENGLAVHMPVESLQVAPIEIVEAEENTNKSPFRYTDTQVETPYYTVEFEATGRITSLYDKAEKREIVAPGKSLNAFYSAEDMPMDSDAWDIDLDYRNMICQEERLRTRKIVADGPLFLTIRSEYAVGRHSTLVQDMTFYARSRRIDFSTQADWHEKHRILKVGFGLDVHANTYRNEIQFGHLTRNLHSNTSWDQAQFEVCAHKWVDLSEQDYGVALLNDCKYGHDSLDNMISLTLLKSALGPDEHADQGEQRFTYALYPHQGGFSAETVVRESYVLNAPPTVVPVTQRGEKDRTKAALCTVSNPNVIIEAVKKAEADDALIVRLYEAGNSRSTTSVHFAPALAKVEACNLLEISSGEVGIEDNAIQFEMRPFEIKTFKVYLQK